MHSISDRVIAIGTRYPNEIALTLNGQNLDYADLIQKIDQAKQKCLTLNLKSGDKAALILPNINETVFLFYALNALGITVVMLHPLSSGTALQERCRLMNCDCVFVLDILEKRYDHKLDEFKSVVVSAAESFQGFFASWLRLRTLFNFKDQLRWTNVDASARTITVNDNQDAVILFSSGTSGHQKAIRLSNEAFDALVDQMEEVIVPQRGIDSMFCVLPFFHGFGLGIAMHTVLALGGRCILVPRLSRNSIIRTLLKEKPTYLAVVPYLLKILLNDQRFVSADLSFIKQVFVGGETVPIPLINKFNAVLFTQGSKAKVQVGYGCTETITAVTLMETGDSGKPGVGKPFRGNSILILKEDGSLSGVDEPGEILIGGPTLMSGYAGEGDQSKQVMIELVGKRYYKTGDIGHLDQQGILHYHNRLDDLIKTKGYLVSPLLITQYLLKVENIEDAKVIISDDDQLTAVLILKHNTDLKNIQKETIQVLKDLDGWMRPQRFVIIKTMPVNEMRKIDMNALKTGIRNRSLEFLSEWSL